MLTTYRSLQRSPRPHGLIGPILVISGGEGRGTTIGERGEEDRGGVRKGT